MSKPLALPAIAPDVLDALRKSGYAPSVGWTEDDLVTIAPGVVGVRDDYPKSERYSAGENYVLWPATLGDTCGANLALDADGWISFGPFDDEAHHGRRCASFEDGLAWLVRGLKLFAASGPLDASDTLTADTLLEREQQPDSGMAVGTVLAAVAISHAMDRGFEPDPADANGMDRDDVAHNVAVVTEQDPSREVPALVALGPAAVAWLNATPHAVEPGMRVVLDAAGLRVEPVALIEDFVQHLPERLKAIAVRIAAQIAQDRASRTVGALENFAALNRYVDANTYGGLSEENADVQGDDLVAVQNALDAWLRALAHAMITG